MAAAGGAVITAAAWRRARAGSPAAAGRGRPAPPTAPSRQSGAAAIRWTADPSTGTATPAPSSSCLKRTAPSPTACTGAVQREQPLGERLGRQRGGREQLALARPDAGEHLAAARVEHRGRPRRPPARRPRPARASEETGTSGSAAALRERAGGRDADPQAGEAARADADGDPLDVVPADAGLGERRARRARAAAPRGRRASPRAGRRAPRRRARRRAARRRRWTAWRCRARARITRRAPRSGAGRRRRARA